MTNKQDGQDGRQVVAATTIPAAVRDAIDDLARVRMLDRSAWLREAIAAQLIAQGADLLQLTGGRA